MCVCVGGGGGHPSRYRVPREWCQNWPLSYKSGKARPMVSKFVVCVRDQAVMHITHAMGGVHLRVRTCGHAAPCLFVFV